MKRWLAVAIVGAMLAVPVAGAAASFTQPGNGPGRTGTIEFEGPQTNDTAFEVELPGRPLIQPVVANGTVYVGTAASSFGANTTENAVWKIDLASGEIEKVLDLDEEIPWRIRPGSVVLLSGNELVALELPSGEERWRVKPLPDSPHPWRSYKPLATVGERLYVPFVAYSQASAATDQADEDAHPATGGVSAVDLSTGEIDWTWTRGAGPDGNAGAGTDGLGETSDRRVLDLRISADEDGVYPYFRLERTQKDDACLADGCAGADADRVQYELVSLDPGGEFQWKRNDTERRSTSTYNPITGGQEVTEGPFDEEWGRFSGGQAVVTPESVHIRLDAYERLNPTTGQLLWSSPAGRSDQIKSQGAYGMGIHDDALVALSPQSATRLDAKTGAIAWQHTNTDRDRIFSGIPLVVDSSTAYLPFAPLDNDGDIGLEAVDLETGEAEWTWRPVYEDTSSINIPSFPAYGPGFAVWSSKDGTVHVVGETEASLGPTLVSSERYAAPGDPVVVDLSGTGPGAFGPPTRYKVDWGDGTTTGWREDPAFRHAYEDSGDHNVHVRVGNEANQTASSFVTVHVGEEPPVEEERFVPTSTTSLDASEIAFEGIDEADRYRVFWGDGNVSDWREDPIFDHGYEQDGNVTARIQAASADNETASSYVTMRVGQSPPEGPNWLAERFESENQDMTFGVLGLLVAVTGGAIGVGRRYRKRSRLEDELETLEQGFEDMRDQPSECEAFLDTRKARARSLALDGVLREDQVPVIENRAEELRGQLRTSALEEEFGFLPYSLVTKARQMVQDGDVTALEKDAFLAAIEEDEVLTSEQRATVRERIERWHGRDAGGSR